MTNFRFPPLRVPRVLVLVAGVGLTSACDPDMVTEGEQVGFGAAFGGIIEFHTGDRVLVDTLWCPNWVRHIDDNGSWVGGEEEPQSARACFDLSASGSGTLEGEECLRVTGLGEARLELAAQACELRDFEDDAFALVGVATDGLTPAWRSAYGLFEDEDAPGQPVYPMLPPGLNELGASGPAKVAAGLEHYLVPALVDAAGPVAFDPETATHSFVGPGELADPRYAKLTLQVGETLDLDLALPQLAVSFVQLVGAEAGADGSLSVVQIDEGNPPSGVGLVRDGAGDIIFGAAVEYEVDAPYMLDTANDELAPFYRGLFTLNHECFEPDRNPRQHRATVRVRHGEFEAERVFEWAQAGDILGGDWEPDERCTEVVYNEGCACSSGRTGGRTGALALVGLLALRRRRRR